jgi:tetratricopeptide (TPR) repeat protein
MPEIPAIEPIEEGPMSVGELDYSKTCFVIMPFGKKPVGKKRMFKFSPWPLIEEVVDFNAIYDSIFKPAIEATPLPEGGMLVPLRTDMNPAAMDIDVLMYQGIVYSRMVLTDISGLNANVFLELGVRLHSNETGTAIFRQADGPVPFDISHIKAVPYAYAPASSIPGACKAVQKVLTESLKQNLVTSPIQRAIREQGEMPEPSQNALKAAEEAIRRRDYSAAIAECNKALSFAPGKASVHFKLGLFHKYMGQWKEASDEFERTLGLSPGYGEAHRELGIAQNKLLKPDSPPGTPDGEDALRRAIEINPGDFDAHCSLGGILKRAGRLDEALAHYETADDLSEGHPYPLLNALKIRAARDGKLNLDAANTFKLARAKRFRASQVNIMPPMDSPWCFFDYAEICLYEGSGADFLKYIDEGVFEPSTRAWQAKTFRESLELLSRAGYQPPALAEGIEKLTGAEGQLPK